MDHAPLTHADVLAAQARIAPYIHRTPLFTSSLLDAWLGHKLIFKAEGFQKIGAFKARGAFNALLQLKEQGKLPKKIVAFSSGNHAQAAAYAGKKLGAEVVLYMPSFTSAIKRQATAFYGAEVRLTATRQEAEAKAATLAKQGYYLLPPYDHDGIIAGQGTACLEALQDGTDPDAVFATTGGGGLISGTWLAAQGAKKHIAVYGGEPLLANDAAQSYRSGKIIKLPDSPPTVADGARTLSLSPRTFHYVKQLDDVIEVTEEDILYWTQWLTHLLKIAVEPTAAVAMAAAALWLEEQKNPKTVLVVLSGGNIAPRTLAEIWRERWLEITPDRRNPR